MRKLMRPTNARALMRVADAVASNRLKRTRYSLEVHRLSFESVHRSTAYVQFQQRHFSRKNEFTSSTKIASSKPRKKRQNIKRQVSLTKREKLLAPAKNKAGDEFPGGEIAMAIKDRIAPTFQSNIDYLRDYAQSLIKSDHPSAKRVGPKMDGKWWTVNIILALTPAALIAMYCEFQRPKMEKYFEEQKARERRRIMGEFGIEGDEEAEYALANNVGGVSITENETKKSFVDRVSDTAVTLYTYAANLVEAEINDDREEVTDSASSSSGDSDSSENVSDATQENLEEAQRMQETMGNADAITAPSMTSETSIEALVQRIEALENQLKKQEEGEYRKNHRKENLIRYQMQRAEQSGVQNRIEDRLIGEWQKEDEENRNNKARGEELSFFGMLKENVRQKAEIMIEYGHVAMDSIKEITRDNSDNPKDNAPGYDATSAKSIKGLDRLQNTPISIKSEVEETAAAVQESARSTQASVNALKEGNNRLATEKAADAAASANEAARIASHAVKNATCLNQTDHESQCATQQGKGLGGWLRSRFRRSPKGDGADGKER